MSQISYNPRELLSVLVEVETKLKSTVNNNCPEKDISLSEDIDDALEEFLQRQSVQDNNVGYLTSQMALFHLCRELEKTIGVVVESNDLRAYHDFKTYMGPDYKEPEIVEKKWKGREMFFGILIGAFLASIVLFLFL